MQWTWLPADWCDVPSYVQTFNPRASTTYVNTGESLSLTYFNNSVFVGTVSRDQLQLTDASKVQVPNFPFLLVTLESLFYNLRSDGIMGLGLGNPVVSGLFLNGAISKEAFSVYFADNDFTSDDTSPQSALLFGTSNPGKYALAGAMEYTSCGEDWSLPINSISLGDSHYALAPQRTAVLDTTVSGFLIPTEDFEWIAETLSAMGNCGLRGSILQCDCLAFYRITDYPTLTIDIGFSLSFSPSRYFRQTNDLCVFLGVNSQESVWRLGALFFREFYVEFDAETLCVSLARAKPAKVITPDTNKAFLWWEVTLLTLMLLGLAYIVYTAIKICRNRSNTIPPVNQIPPLG